MLYYIENLIELNVDTSIKLGTDLIIRSATREEQTSIKNIILKFNLASGFAFKMNKHHETYITKKLPGGGTEFGFRSENDFRYFVLDDKLESQTSYSQIYAKAFLLLENELFVPFAFFDNSKDNYPIQVNFSFDSELIVKTYFNDKNPIIPNQNVEKTKTFNDKDNLELLNTLKLLSDFEKRKKDSPNINKALNDFFSINEISNSSVFKIVSYFACFELLLVDNKFDKLKSIKQQLETKIDLVNNRFDTPILITNYIKGPDTLTLGKVIGISYNYRSSIAHGEFVDFEKRLEILSRISKLDFLLFLRTVLKKLLIFAINDPQLIRDLKNC